MIQRDARGAGGLRRLWRLNPPLRVIVILLAAAGAYAEDLGALLVRARGERDAGHYAQALAAYDGMLAVVPEHETAQYERAQTLSWAGRYPEAIAQYRAFRTAYPQRALDADLRIAQVTAWSGDTRGAVEVLAPWVRDGKREALLDAARYESWASRYAPARELLHRVLADHPGDAEATLALARIALWEGDARTARAELSGLDERARREPDAQLVEAQLEGAEGRSRAARTRLESLVTRGAGGREAKELLDEMGRTAGPWVEFGFSRTDTNEGLADETPTGRARLPLGEGRIDLRWSSHRTSVSGTSARSQLLGASAGYTLRRGLIATGDVVYASDIGGEPAWGGTLTLSARPARGLDARVAWGRNWADYTPSAAAKRTSIDTLEAGATWAPGTYVVDAGVARAALSAGSTRSSFALSGERRWSLAPCQLRTGAVVRGFGYSETLPLGFFNPERYRFGGLTAGVTLKRARLWDVSLDARGGWQRVNDDARQFAWGWGLSGAWQPGGGRWTLSAGYASSRAGLPTVSSADPAAYRDHTVRAAVRVLL